MLTNVYILSTVIIKSLLFCHEQIFSRYEKHRRLILEDILSSLARLPSSKKNLRSYRCVVCDISKCNLLCMLIAISISCSILHRIHSSVDLNLI